MSAVLGRGRKLLDATADDLVSFAEIGRQLGVSAQTIEKSAWSCPLKRKAGACEKSTLR